jgi:hypothetical protein
MPKYRSVDKWGIERPIRNGSYFVARGYVPKDNLAARATEAARVWRPECPEELKKSKRRQRKYTKRHREGWARAAALRASGPTLYAFATTLLGSARERAEFKKLPIDITLPWVLEKLKAGRCEVTGLKFDLLREHEGLAPGQMNPFSPSIDRSSPKLGYTEENARVVVWLYNAAKGSWTDADVLKMAEALIAKKSQTDHYKSIPSVLSSQKTCDACNKSRPLVCFPKADGLYGPVCSLGKYVSSAYFPLFVREPEAP